MARRQKVTVGAVILSCSFAISSEKAIACCVIPPEPSFSTNVILELTSPEHAGDPLEKKALWLSAALNGKDSDELHALAAALEAHCVSSCPEDLQLAKAVVAERLAQRALGDDRKARWIDRVVELSCALISVIGAIIASFAAGFIQSRPKSAGP